MFGKSCLESADELQTARSPVSHWTPSSRALFSCMQVQISQLQAQNQHLQEQAADMTAALLEQQQSSSNKPDSGPTLAGETGRNGRASPASQGSDVPSTLTRNLRMSGSHSSSQQQQQPAGGTSTSTATSLQVSSTRLPGPTW